MKRHRLDIPQIAAEYQSGATFPELAVRHAVSASILHGIFMDHDIPTRVPGVRVGTIKPGSLRAKAPEIREMIAGGMNRKQIAAHFEVTRQTIDYVLAGGRPINPKKP